MVRLFCSSIVLFHFASIVDAFFYLPELSNVPFVAGMATASGNNNTLYMFGGESTSNSSNDNLYQLVQTGYTFEWNILPQVNPPPGAAYGQAVVTENNSKMYIFGGMTSPINNQLIPLQYYEYMFETHTWTNGLTNALRNTTSTNGMPFNRRFFSATYDNSNRIYIYGGALNSSIIFSDFYFLDIATKNFMRLPDPKIQRYGHTASLLSNGQIVIIGGVVVVESSRLHIAPMNTTYVYDTITTQWNTKTTGTSNFNGLPSARVGHSAVVTSDDKIVIFGGSNGGNERTALYLNSFAILDTKTWLWDLPPIDGSPPNRMAYSSAGLINDTYLVVGFGEGLNTFFNAINVLDLTTKSWIQSFKPMADASRDLSAGAIAGIAIAGIIVFVILFLCVWKFRGCSRWLSKRMHSIWRPRIGEPIWTEIARLISQILLLTIFVVFLTFNVRQVIMSPSITQKFEEPTSSVQVPDIRFCFTGYPSYPDTDSRSIGVTCRTDMGYSCNQFVKPLDMSVFQPTFADFLGNVQCHMFRAPTDFVLTSTSGDNNGSILYFTFFADQNAQSGLVHTSIYHRKANPNVLTYGYDGDAISSTSIVDALNWQAIERSDVQVANIFTLSHFTQSALGYRLVEHHYLQDVGWNYIGISPVTNDSYQVTSSFRQNAPNPTYNETHTGVGLLTVFPEAFIQTIEREVRVYNLLTVLGFIGGVLGLLVAFQAWLFGFRPKSPVGVVQRWSIGNMKNSLQRSLRSNFEISNSGIPLVHPVHYELSDDISRINYQAETRRVNHIEDRIQMLETLFKAYYVDDEVFRSIEDANKGHVASKNQSDSSRSTSCEYDHSSQPQTEMLVCKDSSVVELKNMS